MNCRNNNGIYNINYVYSGWTGQDRQAQGQWGLGDGEERDGEGGRQATALKIPVNNTVNSQYIHRICSHSIYPHKYEYKN